MKMRDTFVRAVPLFAAAVLVLVSARLFDVLDCHLCVVVPWLQPEGQLPWAQYLGC
jgi:hypothetical protein